MTALPRWNWTDQGWVESPDGEMVRYEDLEVWERERQIELLEELDLGSNGLGTQVAHKLAELRSAR